MYSKNDYRYYLERQLLISDDYLAHYGVKGMKWKQHLKRKFNQNFNVYKGSNSFDDYYRGERTSKYVGIESKKNPSRYLEVSKSKYKDGGRETKVYFSPTKKEHYKRLGRVRLNTGTEGSAISIDTSKKKRYKKNNSRELGSSVEIPTHVVRYAANEAIEKAKKKQKK